MSTTILPKQLKAPGVTLSLRSARELITRHAGPAPDDVMDALVETAANIADAAHRVKTSVDKILANPMQTPIKNASDAKSAAAAIIQKTHANIDAARDRAEKAIGKLETSTLPSISAHDTPANILAAIAGAEVRATLKGMTTPQRHKAISSAIEAGDGDTLLAATDSKAILAGLLGTAEVAAYRAAWQKKWHPETVDRIGRHRRALAELDRLGEMFAKWGSGILGEQQTAIEAAEKSAAEAAKAVAGAAA
jgi:hypothetical protein